MRERTITPRLADIVEAIENIRSVLAGVSLEDIERDWQKRWLVERGLEINSEASRHLPDDIKSCHSYDFRLINSGRSVLATNGIRSGSGAVRAARRGRRIVGRLLHRVPRGLQCAC
ncbi:MAG: HepT-like ribonuclease domain-containing protein [Beijerinckiaceae bacterium]